MYIHVYIYVYAYICMYIYMYIHIYAYVFCEALDTARRAVAAEQALSCSTSVSTHDLLADCAFVTGSSAVEEATRKVALFQSLQDWKPFNLIRSLASQKEHALDRGSDVYSCRII